jgi:large conductance mechanosensitive channel
VINSLNYGAFFGTVVDFVIVSFAVFMIVRQFLKPSPSAPTKTCGFCRETIPAEATRCRACTSPV